MLDIHKLNKLIKEKKLTNNGISKALENYGIKKSETAIQKYRHGINDPDTKTLSILADILNTTEQDFFVGSEKRKEKIALEEIKKHPSKYKHIFEKENIKSELKQIELLNDNIEYIYIDNFCLNKNNLKENLMAVVVKGDSMSPYLDDGDIVLYTILDDKSKSFIDGKYIIDTQQGLQVKNLKFMLNGNIRIISENSSYHSIGGYDEEIIKDNTDTIKIIGNVISRISKNLT